MTRVVDICDVINDLITEVYEHTFDITINDNIVLETADFLNEIQTMHYEKSFISHMTKQYDVTQFINQWSIYKSRHLDEWTAVYNATVANVNPLNNYSETRTVTPNITVENTVDYGRTTTNTNGSTSGVTYGKTTTGQTNTYDGTLRNSAKTTDSGSDTTTVSGSGSTAVSGTDTSTTATTGTTTETKSGYKESPFDNLQKSIEFKARFNLRDMIINGFAAEFLFYNNDNGDGGFYGIHY